MQAKLPKSLQQQSDRYDQHKAEVAKSLGSVETNPEMRIGSPQPKEGEEVQETLQEAPKEEAQPTEAEQLAKITHRLKTLEGMYRSEKSKREAAEEEAAEIAKKLEAQPPTQPQEIKLEDFFSDEDIEVYGRDYLLKQLKANQKMMDTQPLLDRIEELEGQLRPLKRTAEDSQRQTSQAMEERFWEVLNGKVPNWKQIDTDPEFIEYLQQTNPETGLPLQSLLTDASEKLDGHRVAAIMKGYEASKQSLPDQNMHVHPESAPTTEVSGQQPVFTTAEYTHFMANYRKGRYKSRPEWAEQRLKELEAAYKDGRVR